MHDAAAILEHYHRVRAISNPLGALAAKKIAKATVVAEAKLLGLWHHGGVQIGSEEEKSIVGLFAVSCG